MTLPSFLKLCALIGTLVITWMILPDPWVLVSALWAETLVPAKVALTPFTTTWITVGTHVTIKGLDSRLDKRKGKYIGK